MPGILKMNSSANRGPVAIDGESKKRSHDGKLVNGERNAARKDSPASAPAVKTPSNFDGNANGISATASTVLSTAATNQLPPEIPQLGTEFYHSLPKMIQRIAQEAYNELGETLHQMSELKVPPTNGAMSNGVGLPNRQEEEVNKQKKLLLLKFAHDNRAKFIKLLVLTEWGKKASADVAKLIDLFTWTKLQQVNMDDVDGKIMYLKQEMNYARQYNPDIRTALEVLGTGKAGWIPDMGFIPPPPMTSEKTLKLLRYMNTMLCTRIIVHEKIPRQLSKWRIGDGRVTFTVDGEFEFDLMSFVEDSSEQFHFIDIRLLFSPAPVIAPDSRFFNRLKIGMDNLLRDEGLESCYSYLHNVFLSHKINILSAQAHDLLRTGWADSIRPEFAHRVLWVQYWLNRPGKKNWIEIGVASNKPKDGKVSWRGPPISSISVRWFREGVHVQDVDLNFDWNHLSMEHMIKRVIALHVSHLLHTTYQALSPGMITQATLSETEPSDCKLDVSIGSKHNSTTLSIEPVTGAFTLRPANPMSAQVQQMINRSLDASATSHTITQLLARSILDSVQRYAHQLGWRTVARQGLHADTVKAAVNLNVLSSLFFSPPGWSTNFALAAIVDASGESWWICEMGEKGSTGLTINHAHKIDKDEVDATPPSITRETLAGIQRVAVHQLAYIITARELRKQGKTYSLRHEFATSRRPAALQSVVRGWALHVKTSDLLSSKPGDAPWLEPGMQITGHGFRSDHRNVWHIASGTMISEVAADMQKLMSASPQTNFSFSEGGKFSILLSAPFGTEVVTELKARLRDLDRLRSFATTIKKRKMLLQSSSLEQVQFQYGQSLSVKVMFGSEKDIEFKFVGKNPHNRIRRFLAEIINDRSPGLSAVAPGDSNGLDKFCSSLVFTRPLLTALDDVENRRPGNVDNPAVHAHALNVYRITYTNPPCSFDIRLKPKDDKLLWVVEDNEGKAPDFRPKLERTPNFKRLDSLKSTLQKLFRERNERWYGVRTGIIAEIDGIPDALRKLHEAVVSCYVEGGVKLEPLPTTGPASGSGAPGPSGAVPPRPGNASGPPNRGVANNKPMTAKQQPPPGRPGAGGIKREIITID